jgi:hypothetical protein
VTATDDSSPIADVYAGDTENRSYSGGPNEMVYSYAIEADAEPDVLGRVANLFNLANIAPLSAHLNRGAREVVVISVDIGPINRTTAEMICRKLAQLTCVNNVELAEKAR